MFFLVSKLLGPLLRPSVLLPFVLAAAALLLWTRWRPTGRLLVTLTAFAVLAIAVLPLGSSLIVPLEERFPHPAALPARVDGIVVLAGPVDIGVSEVRAEVALKDTAERLIAGVALSRRFPEAQVVFSGGTGSLRRPDLKEAEFAARVFAALGVPAERMRYENQSRNTFENAVFSQRLVQPRPGEVWLLVTSAFHMPRAMGCFRQIGWEVIPYPVDYRTTGRSYWWPPSVNLMFGLSSLELALHEWVGLALYRLTGRTDVLFPAPRG